MRATVSSAQEARWTLALLRCISGADRPCQQRTNETNHTKEPRVCDFFRFFRTPIEVRCGHTADGSSALAYRVRSAWTCCHRRFVLKERFEMRFKMRMGARYPAASNSATRPSRSIPRRSAGSGMTIRRWTPTAAKPRSPSATSSGEPAMMRSSTLRSSPGA